MNKSPERIAEDNRENQRKDIAIKELIKLMQKRPDLMYDRISLRYGTGPKAGLVNARISALEIDFLCRKLVADEN